MGTPMSSAHLRTVFSIVGLLVCDKIIYTDGLPLMLSQISIWPGSCYEKTGGEVLKLVAIKVVNTNLPEQLSDSIVK